MNIPINPNGLRIVDADFLLSRFPGMGTAEDLHPYGLKLYRLSNCISTGAPCQVICPVMRDGTTPFILKESFLYDHPYNEIAATLQRAEKLPVENLDTAVPVYAYWSYSFWHWMFESVIKILVLEQLGYDGIYIVSSRDKSIIETLELFGISLDRVRFSDKQYFIKKMLLPYGGQGRYLSEELFFLFRNSLLERVPCLPGEKRCYIRRVHGRRKILNEDAVLDVLRDFDFETMTPEEHSVREQFSFMTNASLAMLICGGSATLLPALKHESTLIELFGPQLVGYFHENMIKYLQLQYIPLCSEFSSDTAGPFTTPARFADFEVYAPILRVMLSNMFKKNQKSRLSRFP